MKTDYYVYVYSDPDTRRPIYVGKGCGSRARYHLEHSDPKSEKGKILRRMKEDGKKPIIELVAWNVSSETAFQIESALIQYCGIGQLANKIRGKGRDKIHVDFLDYVNRNGPTIKTYKRPAKGRRHVLWLNVGSRYRPGMNRYELYDAMRGPWNVVLQKAMQCDLIFCLYNGFVIDVYQKPGDKGWFESGEGFRLCDCEADDRCFEFMTRPAGSRICFRYVGRELPVRGTNKGFGYVYCEK